MSAIIADIRSLSIDLRKLKLTPTECKEAVRYIGKLNELGVQLSTLKPFVNLLTRLDKEKIPMKEYLGHGLKMSELEKEIGMNYKELLKTAHKEKESLRTAKNELKEVRLQNDREGKALSMLLADKEKQMRDAKLTNAKIEIAIKIHQLARARGITTQDLLTFMLGIERLNLKLPTLLKILNEFQAA